MPFLELDDAHVYYEEACNRPVLVMLHGLACGSRMWEQHVCYFETDYRVITMDFRGHGASRCEDGERSYCEETQVDDLLALTSHLSLKNIHLAGFSMGARTAAMFAAKYPHILSSLTLVSLGSGSDSPADSTQRFEKWLDALSQNGPDALFDEITNSAFFSRYNNSSKQAHEYIRSIIEQHDAGQIAKVLKFNLMRRSSIYDNESVFRAISTPTLIMVGNEDRECYEVSRYLAKIIPNARLNVFEQTGHLIPLEASEQFCTELSEFLAGRPGERTHETFTQQQFS